MVFKTPAETIKAVCTTGGVKARNTVIDSLLLGFLAGAYIAFGGLLAEVATAGLAAAGCPPGIFKLVFGGVFPVGLILVVLGGADLFTGNCMFLPAAVLNKDTDLMGLGKNWLLSFVSNFIGGVFVAYFLAVATGIMTVDPFMAGAIGVAEKKLALTWGQAFFRAIGCNWLVCLAVFSAVASDDIISKIVGIWFPIMAFVALGFEHSVANMFFIPLGIFLGADVTWTGFLINNLLPVTLGNIVGGAVFVGMLYWFVFLRKKESTD